MDKRILIVSVLVFSLLLSARVFAFDEATRTYSVDQRVKEMENKMKAAEEKMNALANKTNQLEVRAIATDARLDVLTAKLNGVLPVTTVVAPAGTAEQNLDNEKLKKRTSPHESLKSI